MKKWICVLLIMVFVISLVACSDATVEDVQADEKSMFVQVEVTNCWKVVYHRNTKVMYAVSYGGHAYGNFTVLVDQEGKPLLWGEEK